MRRAEWRRRADDPKTLLGWWWRGIVEAVWPLHLLVLMATFALASSFRLLLRAMSLHLLVLMATFALCWGHPAFLGLPFLVIVLMATRLRRWKPDRLAPMLPDPAPEGQFRAKVEYRTKGIVTGRDEMALTFVYGWLHAEGVRSHFALRGEDVKHPLSWSDRQSRFVLSDGSEIRLSGLDYEARANLNAWFAAQESVAGDPTFPPATAHPQELARWAAWWPLGIVVAWLPKLVAACFNFDHALTGSLWAVWIVGGGVAVFGQSRAQHLRSIDAKARKDEAALPGGTPPLQEGASESLAAKRL